MLKYGEIAKRLHREGNRCSVSVYKAFEDVNINGDDNIPAPRSEDGKCGTVLAAEKLIREMGLGDVSDFENEFVRVYGSLKCAELLKMHGRRCNEFVGFTAEYVEKLMEKNKNDVPERVIKMRKAWAENDAKRDAGLKEPQNIEKFRNISYGPYGDWNLLDVYRLKSKAGERLPVIVNIHGGGYFYGDKELYRFYCMHLAEYGFAVINYNYRLSPENKFPAPLEDTFSVFGWISENADIYGLDTDNVFMAGDSAGAQLVSQFACICSNKTYADIFGFKLPDNVRLKGISLACGMYDIRRRSDADNDLMLDYLGSLSLLDDPRTEIHEYITSDYPPAFVFSAENDFLVTECEPFAEFLRQKGIKTEAKIYGKKEDVEVGHVFHINLRLPVGEEANREQADFFKSLID